MTRTIAPNRGGMNLAELHLLFHLFDLLVPTLHLGKQLLRKLCFLKHRRAGIEAEPLELLHSQAQLGSEGGEI